MQGVVNTFSNLPGPVKVLLLMGSGVGVTSAVMSVADPNTALWRIIFIGLLAVAVAIALYVVFLQFRQKSKAKPFASLLSRGGGAAADAATKAQIDDLRKKFEEGIEVYRRAGKNMYSLPWYVIVGPSGSGKTEAMRHCNVGFPPGLSDYLQGTGGTINMHWWFTNPAVVLDTAGRMFMQDIKEWREFLKLLKRHRPHCPINGMLLVISAESLLTDSADQIESTARTIAQRFGEMQTDLDVRFPVFVLVTKCDKIVGFREFFETITDPVMQHQILGWSNPQSLDEPFKPDQIEQHLGTVRTKLMKRRMGLLQNPVHTADPDKRRTDQVDELFELPDNLMRIAPRLKRYLELIFVAGEWSPKPLFLRGIYFTSSMREGHALDVTLAQALGVDVNAVAGESTHDKEKAYFLRDVFVQKTFKEKGLVTKATNVRKSIARQRGLLLGASAAAVLIVTLIAVFGWMDFSGSVKKPGMFWTAIGEATATGTAGSLELVENRDGKLVYAGRERLTGGNLVNRKLEPLETRSMVITETGQQAGQEIEAPLIAMPVAASLGFGDGFLAKQRAAHRALIDSTVLRPLFIETTRKLQAENEWGPEAVGGLAQLIAAESYAAGGKPTSLGGVPFDIDALFKYVLPPDEYLKYASESKAVVTAVNAAYPDGVTEPTRLGTMLGAGTGASQQVVTDGIRKLKEHLRTGGASGGSIATLRDVASTLETFGEQERALWELPWLRGASDAGAAGRPKDVPGYDEFAAAFRERATVIDSSRGTALAHIEKLGTPDVLAAFKTGQEQAAQSVGRVFERLRGALPGEDVTGGGMETLRAELSGSIESSVAAAVTEAIERIGQKLREQWPLLAMGRSGESERRAFEARSRAYRAVVDKMDEATNPGRVESFVDATSGLDSAASGAQEIVLPLANWTPTLEASNAAGERAAALSAGRDRAVAASREALAIVASRRVEAITREFLKRAPANREDAALTVRVDAEQGLSTGEYRKWVVPQVPMSGVGRDDVFAMEYHPQAAGQFLADWAALEAAVRGAGAAPAGADQAAGRLPMLGADAIIADSAFRTGVASAEEYARAYADYWSRTSMELIRPKAANWSEFKDRMPGGVRLDIHPLLLRFKQEVSGALQQLPKSMSTASWAKQAETSLATAFEMLEVAAFEDAAQEVLREWRTLSNQPAAAARETLLSSVRSGAATDSYLKVYRPNAAHVLWWNQFVEAGMQALIGDLQGNLREAKARLITTGRGVPLARGDGALPDLTLAQIKQVRDDAAMLTAAVAGSETGAAARAYGGRVDDLLRQLSGADLVEAGQRAWLKDLQALAAALSEPTSVTIVYDERLSEVPPGIGAELATLRYGYAGLRANGAPQGDTYNIGTGVPVAAGELEKLRVQLPLEGNVQVPIFRGQPQAANAPADAMITMAGPWGPIRALVTAPEGYVKYDDQEKVWRVAVKTDDGSSFLWLRVKFEGAPAPANWPTAGAWPR